MAKPHINRAYLFKKCKWICANLNLIFNISIIFTSFTSFPNHFTLLFQSHYWPQVGSLRWNKTFFLPRPLPEGKGRGQHAVIKVQVRLLVKMPKNMSCHWSTCPKSLPLIGWKWLQWFGSRAKFWGAGAQMLVTVQVWTNWFRQRLCFGQVLQFKCTLNLYSLRTGRSKVCAQTWKQYDCTVVQ